jgi:PAS domain S-box-containing protein
MGRTADKLSAVADELICSADLEGYYTDVNPAFTRLLGWSEAELVNAPYIQRVHEDDREATEASVSDLQATGRLTPFRNRMLRKDGEVVWVEWKAYFHDNEIFAIGRERTGRSDVDVEAVLTRVLRHEAQETEAKMKEREAIRAAERSTSEAQIRDADHVANIAQAKAGTFKTWVGAVVAIASSVGAFGVWAISRVEAAALRTRDAEERKAHVDTAISESVTRDEVQDKKLRVLGRGQIEVQVQVSDSAQWNAAKLDAMSAKARGVPEPPSVERARTKVELIKDDIAVDELFNVPDPDDASNPFAGIEADPDKKKKKP